MNKMCKILLCGKNGTGYLFCDLSVFNNLCSPDFSQITHLLTR